MWTFCSSLCIKEIVATQRSLCILCLTVVNTTQITHQCSNNLFRNLLVLCDSAALKCHRNKNLLIHSLLRETRPFVADTQRIADSFLCKGRRGQE